MGGVRPTDVVGVGVPLSVRLRSCNESTAIHLVQRCFRCDEETRPDPCRLGSEREHGRDPTRVADPASSENRDGCDTDVAALMHRFRDVEGCKGGLVQRP